MRNDALKSAAIDCTGVALLMGGVIVFFGYFWPELTGWVWLAPVVGPNVRTAQVVLCVIGIVTGVGLLKKTEAAQQIAPAVCFLLTLAFLAIAAIRFVQGDVRQTALLFMCYGACGLGAVFSGVLGCMMLPPRGQAEPTAPDLPTGRPASTVDGQEQARSLLQRRGTSLASAVSLVLGVGAAPTATSVTYSREFGLRWGMVVPFVLLCNVVGAGLGWAAFRHGQESSRARKAGLVGTALNLLPLLATLLILVLRRRGHGP